MVFYHMLVHYQFNLYGAVNKLYLETKFTHIIPFIIFFYGAKMNDTLLSVL